MKILKFIILGAATTGLISSSTIMDNKNDEIAEIYLKQNISQNINKIIKEQHNKGFLKANPHISFEIIKPTIVFNDEEQKFEEVTPLNSMAYMFFNKCMIHLTYDKYGNAPQVSNSKIIDKIIKFSNESQRRIYGELVALHEGFHCEFPKIKLPVKLQGKEKDNTFNEKINYYFNEISDNRKSHSIDYLETLNETFADIATVGVLLKKYGDNNEDLQYVLKTLEVQRHASYFSTEMDNHYSHFGLKILTNTQYKKDLINEQNVDKFIDLSLQIANMSVQQLMVNRADIQSAMLKHNIVISSLVNNRENDEASSNSNNFSLDSNESIHEKAEKVTKDFNEILEHVNYFKHEIHKQNKVNEFDASHKDNAIGKINELRKQFLESTRENNQSMKLNKNPH